MPIYDLKCESCGKTFEVVGSLELLKDQACPVCESNNTTRIYNFNGSVVFEGTGWTPVHYPKSMQKATKYR